MSFRRPFDGDHPITTGYLERYPDSVLAQYPGLNPYHEGIDIAMPVGTPLYAVKAGTISYVDSLNDANGMGLILTAGAEAFLYWHVSSIAVSPGQAVQEGQLIALSGNTGYSTGAHLHFQLKVNGALTDPSPYLSTEGGGPTMEEIYKHIFITLNQRWPTDDEVKAFTQSGDTPYHYAQVHYLQDKTQGFASFWGFVSKEQYDIDLGSARVQQDAAIASAVAPLQTQIKTLTDQLNRLENQPAPEPVKVEVPGPTKTITVTDLTKATGSELIQELLARLFRRGGETK